MQVHLMCTSLGYGRKPESPVKTHTDMKRMCKHRDSGPDLESFFFFPHQHYNEMMLNEVMFFKDLLYLSLMDITFLLLNVKKMFIEHLLCYTMQCLHTHI